MSSMYLCAIIIYIFACFLTYSLHIINKNAFSFRVSCFLFKEIVSTYIYKVQLSDS